MDKHVTDLDAERLFAGVNVPDPDQPLTRFTGELRAAFSSPPSASTRALHLQAMAMTRAGIPALEVAPAAPKRRRRPRFVLRGAVAAAALVLVGGTAMAATGTLPDAAQDAVSKVARKIGVKLPRAHPAADIQRIPLDIERPVVKLKVADRTSRVDRDDHRNSDSDSDSDDGSISSLTNSDRDSRRSRRDDDGSAVTGSVPATPDEPSSDSDDDDDSGAIDDGRGDPSGNGDGNDEPDDGTDPGDDDDGDGSGRGDPIDGSPSGADSSSDEGPADGSGAGAGGR